MAKNSPPAKLPEFSNLEKIWLITWQRCVSLYKENGLSEPKPSLEVAQLLEKLKEAGLTLEKYLEQNKE